MPGVGCRTIRPPSNRRTPRVFYDFQGAGAPPPGQPGGGPPPRRGGGRGGPGRARQRRPRAARPCGLTLPGPGPGRSPLAQLATKVVAPRLGPPREVPGPPKRFAQGMGAAITTLGVAALALGWTTVVTVLLAALVVAATLEAAFALCLGCQVFA